MANPLHFADIRVMVKNIDHNSKANDVRGLLETLEKCRNQDNNPDSQAYKRKIQELLDEDDIDPSIAAKVARYDSTVHMQ